jgi:hypothetical protein
MKNPFKRLKPLWAGKYSPEREITQQRSLEASLTLKSCCGNCSNFREFSFIEKGYAYCTKLFKRVPERYYCDKYVSAAEKRSSKLSDSIVIGKGKIKLGK